MLRMLLPAVFALGFAAVAVADTKAPAGSGLRIKPSSSSKPAPSRAPSTKPQQPDPKRIEAIATCMLPGLPEGWKRAWVVVDEVGATYGERTFEASFFFTSAEDRRERFLPRECTPESVAQSVYGLNEYLPNFEARQWTSATLSIESAGKYELKYDYSARPKRPAGGAGERR